MIIRHFTDLDLYKLTVCEVVWTYFRDIRAKYRMTIRNGKAIKYWSHVQSYQFDNEISSLKDLELSIPELEYLRTLNLFSEEFLKFLCNKPMKNVHIRTAYQDEDGACPVPEVDGLWCEAMLFEIFCLSTGNEIYAKNYAQHNDIEWSAVIHAGNERLTKKIRNLVRFKNELNDYSHHPLDITEFGTRRRLSREWQAHVLQRLVDSKIVTGTSNVYLAMKMGIPVKGTFGHEFTMGMQGVTRIQDSQSDAFWLWLRHWKGKLKIALDDTFGTNKFLRDFTKEMAEQFDGLRHDSGDWKVWTDRRLLMYHHFGIEAEKKVLFFSDGLNDWNVQQIHNHVRKQAIPKYGIGTFFTNDTFLPVPQAVMKIIECNHQPVAKLSNNPEKASCIDPEYLNYVKHVAAKL